MTAEPIAIGADVGGSKMILGVVHNDGSIHEEQRIVTKQQSPDWVTEIISKYARSYGAGLPVGVAANGAVDREGAVRFGTFIPWDGYPLRQRLSTELGVPAFVQNDVTVAAWGEYVLDPQQRSVVVIAAGTGVGGGAVCEGKLLVGRGAAMEVGHLPLSGGTRLCGCGKIGCLETVASGTAVEEIYHQRVESADGRTRSSREIVRAAQAGDGVALNVLAEAGDALGEVAALISSIVDPERIVLSGGLLHGAGRLMFDSAVASFNKSLASPNIGSVGIVEQSSAVVDPIVLGAAFLAAGRTQTFSLL